MSGPEQLLAAEEHWVTSLGAFIPSEGRVVMHGNDLHHDLADLSWMGLLMFAICGRRFTLEQVEIFHGIWRISGSYPEPRIWNNRIGALGGTARSSPGVVLAAALAASEARIYGSEPELGAFDFLREAFTRTQAGIPLAQVVEEELARHRVIMGYGRPLRSQDERVPPLLDLANRTGAGDGPHLRLALELRELLGRRRMGMNAAAVGAALCADQGLSRDEYHRGCLMLFSIGITACEHDARRHPLGAFLPVRCTRLAYRGPAARTWER